MPSRSIQACVTFSFVISVSRFGEIPPRWQYI